MTHRTGIAVIVAFVLGLAAAHILDRPTSAQAPNPALPTNARFWPLTVNSGNSAYLVLVNLETGDSYSKFIPTNTNWVRLGLPPTDKAEK